MNHYIEYQFTFQQPSEDLIDYFSQLLADVGFDSFENDHHRLKAYILNTQHKEDIITATINQFNLMGAIQVEQHIVPIVNWNLEWEKNFQPIEWEKKCRIRATFHPPDPSFEHELIIEPKMSFGTGHHETTFQVIQHLFSLHLKNKLVLDMGCGTGILAILALKLGASHADAIDNDPICVESTNENAMLNNCSSLVALTGDGNSIPMKQYDVLIANINRNILLMDMHHYAQALKINGDLILSGFYQEDLEPIQQQAISLGMQFVTHTTKNNWVAAHFKKL